MQINGNTCSHGYTRSLKKLATFLLMLLTQHVQAQLLSPQAKVSLLSIGPGDELYSGFGHSALWIVDPAMNIDRVYNYGTFEFNPDFYGKFVRGKLDYMLSVSDLYYFVANYKEEKRTVYEQVLNLSPGQKEELLKFLEINYLPENRYYRYDFFFDNCSSRIRDVLAAVCKDSLKFNLSHDLQLSPKQMIDFYLQDKKFQDLAMDVGLGAPSDAKLTPYQYMFLPEYLMWGMDSASIFRDGQWQPLVKKSEVLFQGKGWRNDGSFFSPALAIWLLLLMVCVLTYLQFKKGSSFFLWDAIALLLFGILGGVLIFLWFFTDHTVTVRNWDLWWALPLHLPVAILLLKKKDTSFLKAYFLIFAILCALLLFFWRLLPEELNVAVVPLLLIFIVRSVYIYLHFKKYGHAPKN